MVVTRLKGFIILPILTKTLSSEQYGIYALIIASISMLVPICTLKLDFALIRFLAQVKDKKIISKSFISVIGIASLIVLIISIIILLFSKTIAIKMFGDINVEHLIKMSIPLVFLTVVNQTMSEYFRAFQKMKNYTVFQLIRSLGEIIFTSIFVLSGFGLFGAILSLLVVRISATTVGILWIKPEINITRPSFSSIKPYFPFALPLLPVALGHILINIGDRYVIGYFMGSSSVGIYSASYSIGLLLSFFYAPIPIVLFPTITKLFENKEYDKLKTHLQYSLKFFLMLAIPSLLGLLILSRSLLQTLTTPEYVQGYMIVPIIALSVIFYNISDLNNQIIILFKKTKISAIINIVSAIINIAMNVILIPIYGVIGAAISTLISFTLHLILTTSIGYKKMPYRIEVIFILKSIVSSIIMAFIIWLLMQNGIINLLLLVVIGGVIYFGSLLVFRGFSKKEVQFLKGLFVK